MSTLRDGTNVSDIATYRTNNSKNSFKGTLKNQQIFKDLRGGREDQIDEEDDDEDEEQCAAFE